MVNGPSFERKPAGPIGHQAFSLRGANRPAEVGLSGFAELALPTLGRVEGNHMIAGLEGNDAGPHLFNNGAPFVTENGWKDPFRVLPRKRIGIRVANTGGNHAEQYFPVLGAC